MFLTNISNFSNTNDYLPILNGALITDLIVILLSIFGFIQSESLKEWYRKYGLAAVLADVLVLVIVVIISRSLYPFLFKSYSLIAFVLLAVFIQLIHDVSFAKLFYSVPIGKSEILDTFRQYGTEVGPIILVADACMVVSTIVFASLLASKNRNVNMITLIVNLYMVPYLIYS